MHDTDGHALLCLPRGLWETAGDKGLVRNLMMKWFHTLPESASRTMYNIPPIPVPIDLLTGCWQDSSRCGVLFWGFHVDFGEGIIVK